MSLSLLVKHDSKGQTLSNDKNNTYRKIDFGSLNIKLFKVKIYDYINISVNQSDFN